MEKFIILARLVHNNNKIARRKQESQTNHVKTYLSKLFTGRLIDAAQYLFPFDVRMEDIIPEDHLLRLIKQFPIIKIICSG